jgi:hypothetical protein
MPANAPALLTIILLAMAHTTLIALAGVLRVVQLFFTIPFICMDIPILLGNANRHVLPPAKLASMTIIVEFASQGTF